MRYRYPKKPDIKGQEIVVEKGLKKYKPEFPEELIEYMRKGYSFSTFGGEIKVGRDTLHDWMRIYPEFKEAAQIGEALSQKFWETLLIQGSMGILPKNLKDLESRGINLESVGFVLKRRFRRDYGDVEQADTNLLVSRVQVLLPSNGREVLDVVNVADSKKSEEEN